MEARKEQLLRIVIDQFIETAEPVGSQFLVEQGGLAVSAPTIRNEMRELEELGYLTHPHTSAGRIPTEQGYRYYCDHLLVDAVPVSAATKQYIKTALRQEDNQKAVKAVAKYIAEKTQSVVLVSFGKDTVYYTGISYLFAQPEFRNYTHAVNVSEIFDTYEERIDDVIEQLTDGPITLIGSENPLGSSCSLLSFSYGSDHVFSIMGPMRMKYKELIPLIHYLYSLVV